jgi:hypothetical protein
VRNRKGYGKVGKRKAAFQLFHSHDYYEIHSVMGYGFKGQGHPSCRRPRQKSGSTVTLWAEKRDADRWEREGYPKLDGILKLYLAAPAICNYYNVETSLCTHLVEALSLRHRLERTSPKSSSHRGTQHPRGE